jgi:acylaminoacyl-peptidase
LAFRAPDGLSIQGWLMLPPGHRPGDRHPLVLDIHGGPLADYGARFDLEKTLLASRGYAVALINPRGSSGYGTEFANRIHHDFPGDDVGDLLAGVDHILALGVADPARLLVMGISSGGTLAGWIIAHDQRFRAAAMLYPAVNWESMIASDVMPYMPLVRFPGAPWDVPELYRRYSPLAHVGRVRTPTILITGEQDYRTPMAETEQYFAALQWLGVPSRMVRFPGEGHGIRRHPSSVWRKVELLDDWFSRYAPANGP